MTSTPEQEPPAAETPASEAAAPAPAAPAVPLTNDELSRRFYYGGLLGLPWLWIVHALYWHGKQKDDVDAPANGM